jgi:hypothetical protein
VLLCLVPAFFIAGAITVFVCQASVMNYLDPSAEPAQHAGHPHHNRLKKDAGLRFAGGGNGHAEWHNLRNCFGLGDYS